MLFKKINSYLGLVGVIISFISLYFSYQVTLDREESLYVDMDMKFSDYSVSIIPPRGDVFPPFMTAEWEIVVANTSDRPMSIIGIDLSQVENERRVIYGHMLTNLRTLDGESVDIPLNISPGDSHKLIATISYKVGLSAYKILSENFDLTKAHEIDELRTKLCERGIDFIGNAIQCKAFGDGDFYITWETNEFHFYELVLTSSRNNTFYTLEKSR
ncbi:hypothetical protein [Vibrio sp. 624788]|uniref:hypothetical protein n=1 Tax=Vibrio sp. 624788 TaxID=1234362 RepID=UPI000317E59C|nr:hypothetical protein [Vibrio sp. 624788]